MLTYDFFERFHPRIIDVFHRDPSFWKQFNYKVYSAKTRLRSFLYVYDGEGQLKIDGVGYPLAAGSVFQIPVPHQLLLLTSPGQELCYYTVQYDFKWAYWDGGTIRVDDPAETSLPFDYALRIVDPDSLYQKMKTLYQTWCEKKSGFGGQSRMIFLQMLQQVCEQLNRVTQDDPTLQSIDSCIHYIRSHYDQPLDREALARKASLSTSYFSIMFKKYTGCSPVQYITRVRLDKAKQMLRESSMAISEVALEVGFRDPLYFTRVFTHQIGVSPKEYRNA